MKIILKSLCILMSVCILSCTSVDIASDGSSSLSGSYATILTIGSKLYAVNKTSIFTYDIIDPKNPIELNRQDIGSEIESLYFYDGSLLIGSANNMYIYIIDSEGIPRSKSQVAYNNAFNEGCSSDPIVARNNIAYVTLSSTQVDCGRETNIDQLRIYDIENLSKPVQLSSLNMSKPKGLALGKSKLFVCDEIDGLIVVDISDSKKPVVASEFNGYSAYDAIVKGEILTIVANNSIIQYDIKDENNIKYLSTLSL